MGRNQPCPEEHRDAPGLAIRADCPYVGGGLVGGSGDRMLPGQMMMRDTCSPICWREAAQSAARA
jgi:hypothetical protein